MPDVDLLLHGGTAVLPSGEALVDIGIRNGRIAIVAERGTPMQALESLDVSGLIVMPGAIDAHVHLGQDLSIPKSPDDARLESASAAAGGVTTMIAYLMSSAPYEGLFAQARDVMSEWSYTDFGFHFCVVTPEQVRDIPKYCQELGVSSFKVFTNFRGDEGSYLGLPGNDDAFLFDALDAAAQAGGMVAQHAENIELVWRLRQRLDRDAIDGLPAWDAARPAYVEAEAEGKVAYLASVLGASSYAVHVTSAEALDILRLHRQRYENFFVETCPHYLTLNSDCPMGSRAKVNPPLRSPRDQDALWEAIADGTVDVIGSDHVPRHFSYKDKDIWSASAGFPGTGTLLPILISEGRRRGLTLNRIAEITAERPAQLFGLWPRKGAIEAGFDADLVIIDPAARSTVEAATQHSGAEYSVWEGWDVDARILHTLVRGSFALRDGQLGVPTGKYLPRRHSGRAALSATRIST